MAGAAQVDRWEVTRKTVIDRSTGSCTGTCPPTSASATSTRSRDSTAPGRSERVLRWDAVRGPEPIRERWRIVEGESAATPAQR
jgi:hypothetical protein